VRSDHMVGGGFHLRLRDDHGDLIDVRFWDGAAAKFKVDPALREGVVLVIAGFRRRPLAPKELPLAPANRTHALVFKDADSVRYRCEPPACAG